MIRIICIYTDPVWVEEKTYETRDFFSLEHVPYIQRQNPGQTSTMSHFLLYHDLKNRRKLNSPPFRKKLNSEQSWGQVTINTIMWMEVCMQKITWKAPESVPCIPTLLSRRAPSAILSKMLMDKWTLIWCLSPPPFPMKCHFIAMGLGCASVLPISTEQ